MRAILFNAAGGGALHVENLKGATGEIALRVGDNEPFGVINVGDDAKLVKLCEDNGIATQDSEFGQRQNALRLERRGLAKLGSGAAYCVFNAAQTAAGKSGMNP